MGKRRRRLADAHPGPPDFLTIFRGQLPVQALLPIVVVPRLRPEHPARAIEDPAGFGHQFRLLQMQPGSPFQPLVAQVTSQNDGDYRSYQQQIAN